MEGLGGTAAGAWHDFEGILGEWEVTVCDARDVISQ